MELVRQVVEDLPACQVLPGDRYRRREVQNGEREAHSGGEGGRAPLDYKVPDGVL